MNASGNSFRPTDIPYSGRYEQDVRWGLFDRVIIPAAGHVRFTIRDYTVFGAKGLSSGRNGYLGQLQGSIPEIRNKPGGFGIHKVRNAGDAYSVENMADVARLHAAAEAGV